jgi:2-polyprenyl-3-methyl-5-hydroxy-6-metoxy-1,4-benzoquinol methylase
VEKTTSKYRVPDDARAAAARQALLDAAYADAVERQRQLRLTLSPREIAQMADSYSREQAVVHATRNAMRQLASSNRPVRVARGVARADPRVAEPPGAPVSGEIEFTGERFIPGTRGEIWVEHWHRYHFAARWAKGRQVLDVACGEGYGTALLARHAARVTGVDLAPAAIAHARGAYAALANVQFVEASCTQMPLPDASFDVVVSFETVEHISGQAAFLDEIARVLKPGGLVVLSCPNKLEYSDKRDFANEFHVKELYREELATLVGARFPEMAWYGQRPSFFSVIAPEGAARAEAELIEVTEAEPANAAPALAHPLYFLLVAGPLARRGRGAAAGALGALRPRRMGAPRLREGDARPGRRRCNDREVLRAMVKERDGAIGFMQNDIAAWKGIEGGGRGDARAGPRGPRARAGTASPTSASDCSPNATP